MRARTVTRIGSLAAIALASCCLAGSSPAQVGAADPEAGAGEPGRAASEIAAAALVRVEAFPDAVVLERRDAYAQLLLTGIRADGARVDVTRDARLAADDDLVTVDARGLVRPLRDGDGALRLTVGEREVAVPVRVRGQDLPPGSSFVQDVMPILSKRGCNAGTCHGSANGKNGFKLSLRGYDPGYDHAALTDDLAGRRFDRAASEQSLFLLKPTATVPHEGGQRVRRDEPDYAVLRSWVECGVVFDENAPRVVGIELLPDNPTVPEPGISQQFVVLASYADGTVRDVTAHAFVESGDIEVATADDRGLVQTLRRGPAAILARYEGRYAATSLFVMGDRSDFEWRDVEELNHIDTLVYARLREIRALPSELCTDAEFLRRVYLDLTGVPPSPKQVRTFLLDRRESRAKREEVVDRLIGSAEFVEHWSNRWADLLQVNRKFLGPDGARAFREWIRSAVASNMPYDELARHILTARGSTLQNPPAAYYKVLREPDVVMENTTQLFLGVRFNCNKCHDHPFERWTQRQHWELAAQFAQVKREDAPGSKKMPGRTVMKPGEKPPAYEEIVSDDPDAEGLVTDPDGRVYGPSFPYGHDGWDATVAPEPAAAPAADAASAGAEAAPGVSRRDRLAQWLTAEENPYFARSYVNRLWSYLTGRGLIDPVDDIRAGNPPSNPELLDWLTARFVESGFDVRRILRTICVSRVYQHSVRTNRWNEDDAVHFSHALPRRLPAETLHDAVHRATGSRSRLMLARPGTGAREQIDSSVKAKDGFLDLFGRPPRESACECERGTGMSLGQALNLVNGPTVADAILDPDNEIAQLVTFERDPRTIVDELYLRFLCRPATESELATFAATFDPRDIANTAALSEGAARELDQRMAAWEAKINAPQWHAVEPGTLKSAGGTDLTVLDDGSILAGGPSPEQETYTVAAWTDVQKITGVRLEALPHDSLPGKGPGRADDNGNFVLARFRAAAVPASDPGQSGAVEFGAASADFSQNGWPVAEAIVDSDKGWGIHPRKGARHVAVFETKADVGAPDDGGTLLVFTLQMPYGQRHTVGRFRLSVTDSPRPVRHHGLPEDVAALLRVTRAERTDEQSAALYRHYITTDRDMRERIRLGAAQDLAWALANSSAFLFNR